MTWREKCVIRILLLVAKIISDDAVLADEIKALSNHISTWAPKDVDPASSPKEA